MKKLLLSSIFLWPLVASAQDIPNHNIPIGTGPGIVGWRSAAPGTLGNVLISNGASTDPSFQALSATPFDTIFCSTVGAYLLRGSSIWQCSTVANSTSILNGLSTVNETSGGGAWSTKTAGLTINGSSIVQDVALLINKPQSSSSALDIYMNSTSGTQGQAMRIWTDIGTATSYTGSIAATTLTVACPCTGTVQVGDQISDITGNLLPRTTITALGSGTGGAGTYTVNRSQTVASEAMTGVNFAVATYFSNAGTLFTRTGITVSGVFTTPQQAGVTASITPPSLDPNMIGIYGDVNGPALQIRPTFNDNVGAYLISGMTGPGNYVFSVESQGHIGWGSPSTSTSHATLDTFVGRGNAAATTQLGGPDAFAPTAQHFATQNVVASTTVVTTAACAAGSGAVLNFNQGGETLSNVFVGQTVTDTTTPTGISGGTTVLSIDANKQNVTMSANCAGPGVGFGDSIVFASVNAAGVDTFIDASQGTGNATGGTTHVRVAPKGSTGSTQNTLVDALKFVPDPASGFGALQVGLGGNSTPQMTFVPNAGNQISFGMSNGGSQLGVFDNGGVARLAFSGNFTMASGAVAQWTNNGSNPFTTVDAGLARNAAGVVEVDNGTAGTYRDILARALRSNGVAFASLPSAVAGTVAYITDGKNTNCGDTTCTTFGTTVTAGTGALPLLVWYNGTNWTLIGK